jgi:crotonobetainyl-CoA:carnitine CoA-transferase CaiB-like acyl-CoA transferase
MRPGYDFAIQAEAGLMSITGETEGAPLKVGVAVADLATGQNAAIAILAALRHRDASGAGQRVAVSLFDTQLAGLANVASSVLFSGEDARRYGNAHPSIVPYQAFAAADEEFVLCVASEKLWRTLSNALERPAWIDDPRCRDNAARVTHRSWLCAELAALFATQRRDHWLALLLAAGIPAAPVNSVRSALDLPLVRERGLRIEIGTVPLVGSPLRLSATPVRYDRPPPALGVHGDEIAAELGFDPAALRASGTLT